MTVGEKWRVLQLPILYIRRYRFKPLKCRCRCDAKISLRVSIETISIHSLYPILALPKSFPIHHLESTTLILTSCLLTSLKLIQIPSTNRQIAPIFIHAPSEVLDICCTDSRLVSCVGGLMLLGEVGRLGCRFSGRGGTTAEKSADGMPDRGTDCYTAGDH